MDEIKNKVLINCDFKNIIDEPEQTLKTRDEIIKEIVKDLEDDDSNNN